jgi:hypothetical protein
MRERVGAARQLGEAVFHKPISDDQPQGERRPRKEAASIETAENHRLRSCARAARLTSIGHPLTSNLAKARPSAIRSEPPLLHDGEYDRSS